MNDQPEQHPPGSATTTTAHLGDLIAEMRAEIATLHAFDAKVQTLIDLYASQEPETLAIRAFVLRQIERERQQAEMAAAREARADARIARFEDAFTRIDLFTDKIQPYLLALISIAASTGGAAIGAIPKAFFWPLIIGIIVVPNIISSLRRRAFAPKRDTTTTTGDDAAKKQQP